MMLAESAPRTSSKLLADLAADWLDMHAENDRLRTEIGIGADAESLLSRSECWDRVWARLVEIDGGISTRGETLVDSALEVINGLVADRDALRLENERLSGLVHPWYGPCDGFGADGDCSECERLELGKESGDQMVRRLRDDRDALRAKLERAESQLADANRIADVNAKYRGGK